MNDLGQEFVEPIGLNDMSNVTPEVIISNMQAICEEHGIPARFREASVEISMSIFNKATFRTVEISHPNPPQSYCSQLYILYPDRIRFFFVGSNGTGGNLKAKMRAIVGIEPDSEPYEQKMAWHETIYSVFYSLIE